MAVELFFFFFFFFITMSPRMNMPDVGIEVGGRLHAKRTRFRCSYRAHQMSANMMSKKGSLSNFE